MLITGYHGTNTISAQKILSEGFNLSCGKKEWLGHGIYFYPQFSDAFEWKPESGENAVLHAVIKIEENEYFDINSEVGRKTWRKIVDHVIEKHDIELTGSVQENQCAVCRMIWDSCSQLKVLSAAFYTTPSKERPPVLIDTRVLRQEFCVRNNEPIKSTQIVNYKE